MTPVSRSISDTELAVLKTLWTLGKGAVRDVQAALQEQGYSWAYTTVQTLLNRLEQKGYVASERAGRAYEFRVEVDRDELLSQELGDLAERVCGGAALPLVMNLVQGRRFSADEIARFRALLDDLEQQSRSRSSKRRGKSRE